MAPCMSVDISSGAWRRRVWQKQHSEHAKAQEAAEKAQAAAAIVRQAAEEMQAAGSVHPLLRRRWIKGRRRGRSSTASV